MQFFTFTVFYCAAWNADASSDEKSARPSVCLAFDWYRPRWPWMTLNGLIALILRFFSPNSIALHYDYVTVVVGRPKMSVKYCLPVSVFHFCPKLHVTHRAARSLCDS